VVTEICARNWRPRSATRYAAYRLAGKLDARPLAALSGMYPVYQVRLGRKDALRFTQAGHGQREAIDPARVGTPRNPTCISVFQGLGGLALEKHNRY
jgi:hypothetical protein